MMDDVRLQITETGTIRSIYKDGQSQELRDLLNAKMVVNRASNVEWEEVDGRSGWTVRAFWDSSLAIRHSQSYSTFALEVSRKGDIAIFPTREEALLIEVLNFWELLPKERK